jgi:ABC-type sugar transport system permease subunit
MYLAGIESIPKTLFEAAQVDGASSWYSFWRITLPLLRPIVLTASLIQFIWVFRFFDLIWIMTRGGPVKASEVLATEIYKTALYRSNFNEAAALGIIMGVILLIFVLVYLYFYNKVEGTRV